MHLVAANLWTMIRYVLLEELRLTEHLTDAYQKLNLTKNGRNQLGNNI
jgi:hypothetical protein